MSINPETLLDEMLGSLTTATKTEPVQLAPVKNADTKTIAFLVDENIHYLLCKKEITLEEISLLTALVQWRNNA
jgi:hypothetical protein